MAEEPRLAGLRKGLLQLADDPVDGRLLVQIFQIVRRADHNLIVVLAAAGLGRNGLGSEEPLRERADQHGMR